MSDATEMLLLLLDIQVSKVNRKYLWFLGFFAGFPGKNSKPFDSQTLSRLDRFKIGLAGSQTGTGMYAKCMHFSH